MPLVTDDFDKNPLPGKVLDPIKIEQADYRGITVTSRYEPKRNLLSYVSGSKWEVNYYSQLIDKDSGIASHQITRPGYAQSYRLIKQFILKVTTPIQDTQDITTGQMALKGAAHVMPGTFIPNVGDVFLSDVGDGKEGYFEVTMSEKLSAMRDSVYAIEYSMIQYSSPEIITDLTKKTVDTLYFNKDYFLFGERPYIRTDEMEYLTQLTELYEVTRHMYFKKFFDEENQTLVVPHQDMAVYDPFLVDAVMSFMKTNDEPTLLRMKVLNVNRFFGWDVIHLWTCLLERRIGLDKLMHPSFGLIYRKEFPDLPLMNSIRLSRVDYCVWPVNYIDPVKHNSHPTITSAKDLLSSANGDIDAVNKQASEGMVNSPAKNLPLIQPVSVGGSYILSESFYASNTPETLLEDAVRMHLQEKYADPAILKLLLETALLWGDLEQFYYLPIVWILVRNYAIAIGR